MDEIPKMPSVTHVYRTEGRYSPCNFGTTDQTKIVGNSLFCWTSAASPTNFIRVDYDFAAYIQLAPNNKIYFGAKVLLACSRYLESEVGDCGPIDPATGNFIQFADIFTEYEPRKIDITSSVPSLSTDITIFIEWNSTDQVRWYYTIGSGPGDPKVDTGYVFNRDIEFGLQDAEEARFLSGRFTQTSTQPVGPFNIVIPVVE